MVERGRALRAGRGCVGDAGPFEVYSAKAWQGTLTAIGESEEMLERIRLHTRCGRPLGVFLRGDSNHQSCNPQDLLLASASW